MEDYSGKEEELLLFEAKFAWSNWENHAYYKSNSWPWPEKQHEIKILFSSCHHPRHQPHSKELDAKREAALSIKAECKSW